VHAFLVPIRDEAGAPMPGVRIADDGRKHGLNGVDNGRLWFDQVRVPRENLLNRYGDVAEDGTYTSPITSTSRRFFTMLGTLVGGRISVALSALSASKSGLAIAVRYGALRRQFGPAGGTEIPILDYLTHQRRLLPALATTYALDFALKELVARFGARSGGALTEADDRELEVLAAGLKAYTTWHNAATLQACRECCGGQGYLAVNRITPLRADTDITTTFEGDNTVLMQLVAKGLLTGYRQQFGTLRLVGVLRHLSRRATRTLAQLNPIVTRLTDEAHLRDPDFQRRAFQYREERLLASAAGWLRARIQDGMDSFLAFNECQDHLLALARAHVERVVLERFRAAAGGQADPALRAMLTDLCDLFALARLEADEGWFLTSGVFEGAKARAIRALVNRLCGTVRRQAVPLVNAFGIPDEILAAPIAFAATGEW
jgi:acyl-CoA oxidase